MPRYPYVLLDADNTLFDFDAAEHQALDLALTQRGYPADEAVHALYLSFNRALWAAFDRGEVSQEFLVVERFRQLNAALGRDADPGAFNRDYLTFLGRCSTLLPGAEALCRDLAEAGCTLALCTNGVARVQHARLAASPLRVWIPHLFISEELGFQKPQKEFFDRVFDALDLSDPPRQAVMVGDSLSSDILGGIRAGIDTLWYDPHGLPPRPDVTPTYTARTYDQVREILLT